MTSIRIRKGSGERLRHGREPSTEPSPRLEAERSPDVTPLLLLPLPNTPITCFAVSPLDGVVLTTHSNGLRMYKTGHPVHRRVSNNEPRAPTNGEGSLLPASWGAYLPSTSEAIGRAAAMVVESSASFRSLTRSEVASSVSPDPEQVDDSSLGGTVFSQYRHRSDLALLGGYLVATPPSASSCTTTQTQHRHHSLQPSKSQLGRPTPSSNPSLLRSVIVASGKDGEEQSISILSTSATSNVCKSFAPHGACRVTTLTVSANHNTLLAASGDTRGRVVIYDAQSTFTVVLGAGPSGGVPGKTPPVSQKVLSVVLGVADGARNVPVVCSVCPDGDPSILSVEVVVHRVYVPPAGVGAASLVSSTVILVDSFMRNAPLRRACSETPFAFCPVMDTNTHSIFAPRSKGRLVEIDGMSGLCLPTEVVTADSNDGLRRHLTPVAVSEREWALQIISVGLPLLDRWNVEVPSTLLCVLTSLGQVVLVKVKPSAGLAPTDLVHNVSEFIPADLTTAPHHPAAADPCADLQQFEEREKAALEAFLGGSTTDDDGDAPVPTRNIAGKNETTAPSVRATPVKVNVKRKASNNLSSAATPHLVPGDDSQRSPCLVEEVFTLYDPRSHVCPSNARAYEESTPTAIFYEPFMQSIVLYFGEQQHLMRIELPPPLASRCRVEPSRESLRSVVITGPENSPSPMRQVREAEPIRARSRTLEREPSSILRSMVGFGLASWTKATEFVGSVSEASQPGHQPRSAEITREMSQVCLATTPETVVARPLRRKGAKRSNTKTVLLQPLPPRSSGLQESHSKPVQNALNATRQLAQSRAELPAMNVVTDPLEPNSQPIDPVVHYRLMAAKRQLQLDDEPADRDQIEIARSREWRAAVTSFEQEAEAIAIVHRILHQRVASSPGVELSNTIAEGGTPTTATRTRRNPPPRSSKSIHSEKERLLSAGVTSLDPRFVNDNVSMIRNASSGFHIAYRYLLERYMSEEKEQSDELHCARSTASDDEDPVAGTAVLGVEHVVDTLMNVKLTSDRLRSMSYRRRIAELQDRDRVAYEVAEIESHFQDRLSKLIVVETITIEENSRVTAVKESSGAPKKRWAPHPTIRFQTPDGTRVDWEVLNATFGDMRSAPNRSQEGDAEVSTVSSELSASHGRCTSTCSSRQAPPTARGGSSSRFSRSFSTPSATSGREGRETAEATDTPLHPLWSVGPWVYARVFPMVEPAPASHWLSYENALNAAKTIEATSSAPLETAASSTVGTPVSSAVAGFWGAANNVLSSWTFGSLRHTIPTQNTEIESSSTQALKNIPTDASTSPTNNFPFRVRRRTLTRTRVTCTDNNLRLQLERERDEAVQAARRKMGLL